jgi:hypothetical protein
MSQLKYGPVIQLGYVVENLDASIGHWTDTMGVGPWTVFRNVTMEGVCRGEATTVRIDVALGYQNELQVELIQQTSDTVSPYRTPEGKPILGLHHIAWLTDDLDGVVAQAEADGAKTIFRAQNPGTRVAYLTLPDEADTRIEFIESASTADLIKAGIAATRDWDGTDPVTVIDFAAQ